MSPSLNLLILLSPAADAAADADAAVTAGKPVGHKCYSDGSIILPSAALNSHLALSMLHLF